VRAVRDSKREGRTRPRNSFLREVNQ
jgi:hypothetical protein